MAVWVSCGSIRDRKITVQGFSLPKICTRISCFLQIKLSLNPDSAGLSFPCILSKPSCTLRLCGNPIFWKLSKSASASYPPSAELSTFPNATKVQLSVGPFSYFIFASEADLADLLQGCFGTWHLINSVRNLHLATCPAIKGRKRGHIRQKPGGGGVAGYHRWWNK